MKQEIVSPPSSAQFKAEKPCRACAEENYRSRLKAGTEDRHLRSAGAGSGNARDRGHRIDDRSGESDRSSAETRHLHHPCAGGQSGSCIVRTRRQPALKSSTMSPNPGVIKREVNPAPAAVNPAPGPAVPAPRIKSVPVVVVAPLSAVAELAVMPVQLSSGKVVLRPLYSRMRTSGATAA